VLEGGFAGLTAGAGLVENGINPNDIRIVEKGGDLGGTWYWNRYPGAYFLVATFSYFGRCLVHSVRTPTCHTTTGVMCDTAAMVYMPLLEVMKCIYSFIHVHSYAPHVFVY
jgi:hypothetical protein